MTRNPNQVPISDQSEAAVLLPVHVREVMTDYSDTEPVSTQTQEAIGATAINAIKADAVPYANGGGAIINERTGDRLYEFVPGVADTYQQ